MHRLEELYPADLVPRFRTTLPRPPTSKLTTCSAHSCARCGSLCEGCSGSRICRDRCSRLASASGPMPRSSHLSIRRSFDCSRFAIGKPGPARLARFVRRPRLGQRQPDVMHPVLQGSPRRHGPVRRRLRPGADVGESGVREPCRASRGRDRDGVVASRCSAFVRGSDG